MGLLAAQVCHAAGESAYEPVPPGTHAVVLSSSKSELEALEARLRAASIAHAAIRENTVPYAGELVAIGLQPCLRECVKRFVSALPLLKEVR